MATQTIVIRVKEHKNQLTKKAASIIFFLLLFYVIPLALKPELLTNWKVIFLAVICSVLFATQPRLSIAEAKEKKGSDKNTIWLILVVSGIGQVISLIDWAYFVAGEIVPQPGVSSNNLHDLDFGNYFNFSEAISGLLTVIGLTLLIAGTLFRLYAIKVLGKYFTSTVQIKSEHRIISQGPYKFLRHPSYTGAYIAMLGSAVFLHSIIGVLIFGIGMLFVYHLRIKTEEQTLIKNFKEEYLNYSKHTYKMFPYLW